MDTKYTHARTCIYNLNYHIVWCVKYRRKVLDEEISSFLYDALEDIAKDKGFTIVEAKVGDADHIHVFVSIPPKLSVTQVVKWMKGISGRRILHFFPQIKEKLWHGNLWNGSYFAESIGHASEENILKYIERQKNVQL